MGQYRQAQLQHYAWLREKTHRQRQQQETIQNTKPTQINIETLAQKLARPEQEIHKTIEKLYGPKTRKTQRLYHWWQEPYGAIRKVWAEYLHTRIREAMKKIGVENPSQLARKMNVPDGKTTIMRDWMRQKPVVSAKTGVLKRILTMLKIPLEELEEKRAILDRKFPINLNSPKIVK
ncbi:MAG: hypothetical protein DRN95_02920, partial [Candidatus Hydrothermarchaeota archaeon]